MRTIKVKDDTVNIHGLKIEMRLALKIADTVMKSFDRDLVITSARDGLHSPGSYHYYGYAVDIRTRDISYDQKSYLGFELRKRLGKYYDVVVHKTHIHVEFDHWRYTRAMSISAGENTNT